MRPCLPDQSRDSRVVKANVIFRENNSEGCLVVAITLIFTYTDLNTSRCVFGEDAGRDESLEGGQNECFSSENKAVKSFQGVATIQVGSDRQNRRTYPFGEKAAEGARLPAMVFPCYIEHNRNQSPAARVQASLLPSLEGPGNTGIVLEDILAFKALMDRIGPDQLRALIDVLAR
jgi:hypothetical protein